jgi:hypothetical protein
MRSSLAVLSAMTCIVSSWMFVMYLVLRHQHYELRAGLAGLIFVGAATLLGGRPLPFLRIPTYVWGAAVTALGVWALAVPGDDGWVLIAGALFAAEGILALLSARQQGYSTL